VGATAAALKEIFAWEREQVVVRCDDTRLGSDVRVKAKVHWVVSDPDNQATQ
jgi:hypothetical protein